MINLKALFSAPRFRFEGVLLSLFLFFSLLAFMKVYFKLQFLHWDFANHMVIMLDYYQLLTEGRYWKFLTSYHGYPPLLYWIYSLLILFFGYSRQYYLYINFFFAALMIYSVTLLGRALFTRAQQRLFLSLFFLCLAVFLNIPEMNFWTFMLDFPLVCLVVAIIAFIIIHLLRDDADYKNNFTLSFFIFCLLLTKWPTAIFLVVPLTVLFIQLVFRKRYITVLNILSLPILALVLWYYPNLQPIVQAAIYQTQTVHIFEKDPLYWEALIRYIHHFGYYLWPYYLVISVFIVIQLVRKNKFFFSWDRSFWVKSAIVTNSFLFPGLMIVWLNHNYDVRYIAPLFFLGCLMGAYLVCKYVPVHNNLILACLLLGSTFFFCKSLWSDASATNLAQWVLTYAKSNSYSKIFYFVEEDSRFFNNAVNDFLNSEQVLFSENPIMYQALNYKQIFTPTKNQCEIHDSEVFRITNLLVVYSNNLDQGDYYAPFLTNCPDYAEHITEITRQSDELGGTVILYALHL